MKDHIWEGVYNNFSEVPADGSGFSSERWTANSLEKIESLRAFANEDTTVTQATAYHESILPAVAAITYSLRGGLRLLDFGGGLGFAYYHVSKGLPRTDNFEYHVKEIDSVCKAGKEFFAGEKNIFYHTSLPEESEKFDIVHMGSSIQYIEKWQDLILTVSQYNPQYLLLTDLPAADIPTYASFQNYYGSKIPCWFFNVNEFIKTVEQHGFKLIHKAACITTILGIEQPYPQENFDEKDKLGYPCILLFQNAGV